VRNSGTQHFTEIGPAVIGTLSTIDDDWATVTSFSGTRVNTADYNGFQYVRIVVTSTTAYSGWVSTDGNTWTRVFNTTGDGFLGTPDQVGFGADSNNSAAVDMAIYEIRCS